MYFRYFVIISLSFKQFWILFTQRFFVPSLVAIVPVVLETRPLNSLPQNVFLLFRYYLPFEKDMTFHLNKLESPVMRTYYCIEPRDNYLLCLRRGAVILKNTDKSKQKILSISFSNEVHCYMYQLLSSYSS